MVFLTHSRRYAALLDQCPVHAEVGGVLQVDHIVQELIIAVAAAHHELELDHIRWSNVNGISDYVTGCTFLVGLRETR